KEMSTTGEMQVATHLFKDVDVDTIFKSTSEIITRMCQPDILHRLAKDLWQSLDENSDSSLKPDLDRIVMETGIYSSYDKLQEQATFENLLLLAKNSTLEIRFGRKKSSGKFVSRI